MCNIAVETALRDSIEVSAQESHQYWHAQQSSNKVLFVAASSTHSSWTYFHKIQVGLLGKLLSRTKIGLKLLGVGCCRCAKEKLQDYSIHLTASLKAVFTAILRIGLPSLYIIIIDNYYVWEIQHPIQ